MGYEEVSGGGYEEREFVSAKIGTTFEGTYKKMGPVTEGQYGTYRVVEFDTEDGQKMAVRASKILLERLESAALNPGDRFKVSVESATAKKSGRTYSLPRLFVDRSDTPQPQQPTPVPVADDDEPPF